ncbi:hypothetical protein IFM89_006634 [Coptis chinensis]|uniref:DNA 3'-5' helicase n=1 Tax=Coptis chinensis TaxID=261450 RepID=A0A835HJX3_9MAGN|nr:hypothetical protein IFM89_006634 [Coptis chinensis]
MGIDRKDVRTVCHFNIPKSMEAFYQESGRTGRDRLPSRSLLYYGIDDREKNAARVHSAEDQFTEFWNREDEASLSEEDISASDGTSSDPARDFI